MLWNICVDLVEDGRVVVGMVEALGVVIVGTAGGMVVTVADMVGMVDLVEDTTIKMMDYLVEGEDFALMELGSWGF